MSFLALKNPREASVMAALTVSMVMAPFFFPQLLQQLTMLWLMVVFALTWDMTGGQMGYNSFGNVLFFGIGAYAGVMVQREAGFDYHTGFVVGVLAATVLAGVVAMVLGTGMLGLRGHYFAIGTLGLGIAAGELAGAWDLIGAGSGLTSPLYPADAAHGRSAGDGGQFFYWWMAGLAVVCFLVSRALYQTRFGLALNAIRDDEDKAEALGLPTTSIKIFAWSLSACLLGAAGAIAGNVIGFIDPKDVAFAGATFGVWMVLMAILGGKGTLWGPVLGAVIFHLTQELFWTYLLGWQRVALGLFIISIVVFFPEGILGSLRTRFPALFGVRVEERS